MLCCVPTCCPCVARRCWGGRIPSLVCHHCGQLRGGTGGAAYPADLHRRGLGESSDAGRQGRGAAGGGARGADGVLRALWPLCRCPAPRGPLAGPSRPARRRGVARLGAAARAGAAAGHGGRRRGAGESAGRCAGRHGSGHLRLDPGAQLVRPPLAGFEGRGRCQLDLRERLGPAGPCLARLRRGGLAWHGKRRQCGVSPGVGTPGPATGPWC
mmetsp:Transcript_42750/g.92966  ORF Transcript_42750/g.92966 Transcript_42750/m.92966 type:complete len:213 (-) Transcript_42750:982-1620(-)